MINHGIFRLCQQIILPHNKSQGNTPSAMKILVSAHSWGGGEDNAGDVTMYDKHPAEDNGSGNNCGPGRRAIAKAINERGYIGYCHGMDNAISIDVLDFNKDGITGQYLVMMPPPSPTIATSWSGGGISGGKQQRRKAYVFHVGQQMRTSSLSNEGNEDGKWSLLKTVAGGNDKKT